ncbi:hypothetical protein AXE65_06340 [Ventosimonas gracilis]|uniref:Lipoprotein n=1 Tax=Ventosimonas gracilis TaxID=1680762 RepID=A0A139SLD3_9GAMM|nr:hypothetical protein [Ventosimonas gracilis]KXU35352.1 hypothetical protein AXE65_06340 [Ventosimonas gracilis]
MQKILLMSALLLLAVGCSEKKEANAKTAQSTETAKTTTVAQDPFEKEFIRSCVKQYEGKADISTANLEKMCLCTLAGIKKKYSLAQLKAIDSASETEKMEIMRDSISAGLDCSVRFKRGQL